MPEEVGAFTRETREGTHIMVRVQPRSRRNRIEGVQNDRLKVRLTAPPVEGAANEALIALLAKVLRVPKRDVAIVRGVRGREKVVLVRGLTPAEVEARLAGVIGGG